MLVTVQRKIIKCKNYAENLMLEYKLTDTDNFLMQSKTVTLKY